jgi:hypothetical protein
MMRKWKTYELHQVPKRNSKISVRVAIIVDGEDEASIDQGKKAHSQLNC